MSFYEINKPFDVEEIFNIHSSLDFNAKVLQIFHFQYKNNELYKKYVDLLKIDITTISQLEQIPFLPVSFFKTHKVLCGTYYEEVFSSSATSQTGQSMHYVSYLPLYEKSFTRCFNRVYGDFSEYAWLALLPGYMERKGSSLIYMVNYFIKHSKYKESGFYLHDYDKLKENLLKLKAQKIPVILLGVSFALLDFAEKYTLDLSHVIIMETGGMKGRREEITREELHKILCENFQVRSIHSEYGMTELLSQFYSKGQGIFTQQAFQKILIRDISDPFNYLPYKKRGAINIIDLTNVYSCSFIATDDMGLLHNDSDFEVLGRKDNSELRGCNLLI
jgi:hypothetical protein